MNIQDRQGLKARAAAALSEASYSPGKLALIHTGAAAALSLLLTVLNYVLTDQIGGTGGLSGMGLRSVLSTAQTMLSIVSMAVMPFWELGFVYAALRMARKEQTAPENLLQGFRRFGPMLRLTLLQGLIYLAIVILCINISSAIFIMTPFSLPLAEALQTLSTQAASAQELMVEVSGALIPFYCIFAILLAVMAVPVLYRFRLAQYLIVDEPKTGALAALGTSHRLMRYNRWAMFRLDLSFWWFYGLQLLSFLLAYGDVLAAVLGIRLPVSEGVAFFGFYVLHCASQLLIAWRFASPVAVTYATAYETLQQMHKDAEPQLVKNFPWDFLPEREREEQ